jgi:hypothetical protein
MSDAVPPPGARIGLLEELTVVVVAPAPVVEDFLRGILFCCCGLYLFEYWQ